LALLQFTGGDLEQGILGANAVAKVADGAAPLTGAFCGSVTDSVEFTETWGRSAAESESFGTLAGVCVPATAGVDYIEMVKEWVEFCSSRNASFNTTSG
jgi:hypothetical protein